MTREEEIFGQALDLPPAERAAFLARACGDDRTLHDRVAELLAACDASGDFLEGSLSARLMPQQEEKPGDVIGHYTLIEKIGEGGWGVVYLAEQTEPVRRRVALKVIKLGMDTRQVILRFEAERQALALMDHADIARVYDAGATAAGRPYFVMEFVDGAPITKFCDAQQLPMAARLELFARVCLALQHAHQKGIVHRDVKPSNILVTLQDGVPAPKVIDFGIAKATQGRLTEATLATGFDQFLGTPSYMSPEQAELRDLDIDTRSDVYSLGVLLYELLTGRPPFDPKSLVRAGIEEIRRIIREVDPPRPSTVVSTLGHADRATVAQLRGAAPARLTSTLQGDLDWIVMRCLEKDRARRYSTAHELADDVRRHLRSEPVLARPPQLHYVAKKFVARHRLACASAAALAASLILGTVISVRQAIRATRAETVAQGERASAQRRQEQAEALLTFMLGDFRTELKKIGKLTLLDSVGDKALAHFAALDPRDLTDTTLTSHAKALTQIGEIRLDQARYPEAATAFSAAYARASILATRHPDNADMLFERGQSEYWIGSTARRRGDLDEALAWLTRYRDSALQLAALEGPTPRAELEVTYGHHNLAVLDYDRGSPAAAESEFLAKRAATLRLLTAKPADPQLTLNLADTETWLGIVAEADGRYDEALAHHRAMLDLLRPMAVKEPDVPRWQIRIAEGLVFTADVLAITGGRAESLSLLDQALAIQTKVVALDPGNHQWAITLAAIRLKKLALEPLADNERSARLRALREDFAPLATSAPLVRAFSDIVLSTWVVEGQMSLGRSEPAALAAATQSIEIGEALVAEKRAYSKTRWYTAQAHLLAGRIDAGAGRPAAANAHWGRVIDLLVSQTNSRDWRVLDPLAQAYVLTRQPDLASPLIERLRRSGYRSIEPLSATILGLSPQP